LAKTINILHDEYHRLIEFWGWKRKETDGQGEQPKGIFAIKFLISGGGFDNKFARLLYIPFMFQVFFYTLFYSPKRVYCLGLETALPVWLASKFRRHITYLFDDADRLVLIWSMPKLLESFIVYFERKVSRDSVGHIIPSLQRYNYSTDKQIELKNSPTNTQVTTAKQLSKSKENLEFGVYINGWLGPSRGLELLDQAATILEEENNNSIIFNLAAGNLTGDTSEFTRRINVNYLGSLSQIDALSQYSQNDVVVTFYDPSIPINTFAISNKWGDAIAMNCPIILNHGISTAKQLLDIGAAVATPFDDPKAFCELLISLQNDKQKLTKMKKALKKISPNYKPFDEAMKPILEKFI